MLHHPRILALVLTLGVASGCAGAVRPGATLPGAAPDFVVVESRTGAVLDFDSLGALLREADVIFFGEIHDDSVGHALQLRLLGELARGERKGVLGLEMFGRDVQPAIDSHVTGSMGRDAFVTAAAPWGNYASAYEPIVERAGEEGWRVVGTNLPQSLAIRIAREGLDALASLPPEQRAFAAAAHDCSADAYWNRFVEEMTVGSAPAHRPVADESTMRRMFEAQCARDEAMAESVAAAVDTGRPVFHLNGRFHSDYRDGIVSRLARRRPHLEIRTISVVPVPSPHPDVARRDHLGRADFIILTRGPGSG